MTERSVPSDVANIPVDYERLNLSPRALIERSGYLQSPEFLTRERVTEVLRANPDLIEAWLTWSANKRTPEACVFDKTA